MKLRVLHKDGRDSLYDNVVKIIEVEDIVYIYTSSRNYTEYVPDVVFKQIWCD